ncbi:MAG: HD domain-containing protein [Treponema sp.]|jgi:HD-GYP domain-containing protein (c-di-GMP phosphodiesterase class II)|nr:HD domain-containing protein [Treponema sp.]
MTSLKVTDLLPETWFSGDVCIDTDFIFLPAGVPLPAKLKALVQKWGFQELFTEGETVREFRKTGEPAASGPEQIVQSQKIFATYCRFMEITFTDFSAKKLLDYSELVTTSGRLVYFIEENQHTILRIPVLDDNIPKSDIIRHAVRSAILAISIGIQFKMKEPHLIDLGIATLVHEIGKLRIPPQLYTAGRWLSPTERNRLHTQPLLGGQILASRQFPGTVIQGVMQHREREDGSGYPRQLVNGSISPYGRIIAVACAFETISSPRAQQNNINARQEMVDLLKNTGGKFDQRVIDALRKSQQK